MALGRFRVVLGLDRKNPTRFLSLCHSIYTGLATHPSTFVLPTPELSTLFTQLQNANSAQQLVATRVRGAVEARDAQFALLGTSMEMERMMVQALCDAAPAEQAPSIAALASMRGYAVTVAHKDLLAAKNITPSGSALLIANATLLEATTRRKTFNWGYTLDGGRTTLYLPSTPVARTTVANLVPLTMVGFTVSVTVNKRPPGAWTPFVYLLIR
jgi:hypothetical protein